ncbi:sensor histidine kinase N-terminal domain-containing protein [Pseudoduganella ginsengisoli]|uniref:histidine kinase n=1 Tax=Pseudoduganella ginsengisoli TaxID=1462440 RepID=A0A6L6Q0U7_9BURK|nr:sensor histidine kinase [Pseudoduganella ginsengisoli]MTW03156.1 HAMP domain-containing protein [Pseudoduganella ginsengisoli]
MRDAPAALRPGSIRLRLMTCLIGPFVLISLIAGVLTYLLAWLPAQMAYDQNLFDAASALGARLDVKDGAWRMDLPPQAEQVLRSGDIDRVAFAVRDGSAQVAGDRDFPPLRKPPKVGVPIAYDGVAGGEPVRIAALRVSRGQREAVIGVAKTVRMRAQIRQTALRALLALGVVATVGSIGLAWLSVTNGLRPLDRMRSHLNARSRDDLEPIPPEGVPYELEPVVLAFNGLLARVESAAQAQQDFLADAAHQLRTPLAGLQAQLEWLAQRHRDPETAHTVALMLSATERMARQSKQLLALARAESGHLEKSVLAPMQLDALVGECVQQFVEQAARKHIDLGFELEPAAVLGERFLLRDLIDNLIDNALRYTPEHGMVTVRCRQSPEQGSVLEVEDSGPGIPPPLRSAVFDRHVRLDSKLTGNGLGLAIVRDIAAVHGATVAVGTGAQGVGALFTVRFPASA